MKKSNIFWGIVLILSAILIIFDAIGTNLGFLGNFPAIRIILGVLCIAWAVTRICRGKIHGIFFPLAFLFILFEAPIASLCGKDNGNLISNWIVLLAALLLTIGFGMITHDARIRKCIPRINGNQNCFSSATKYIDSATFTAETIENNMGSLTVFFENPDEYRGGGVLTIENNMGSMVINIPSDWCINDQCEKHMGSFKTTGFRSTSGKDITIKGECNMGSVEIKAV